VPTLLNNDKDKMCVFTKRALATSCVFNLCQFCKKTCTGFM